MSNYKWNIIFDDLEQALQSVPENKVSKHFINGKWVCMSRNKEKFYAFSEECPHQKQSLMGGECNDGNLTCPVHRYTFDLETGYGEGFFLQVFPVKYNSDGQLLIGMNKQYGGF